MTVVIGQRIKELRIVSNMSQEELGRRVGVQRAAINKYEKGTVTNVPLSTIEKIADVFDVSPTYLVGWDNKPIDQLALEVKLISGIKSIFGDGAVEILETYMGMNQTGRKRLQAYGDEIWRLYHLD